jgi:hypothetical protein
MKCILLGNGNANKGNERSVLGYDAVSIGELLLISEQYKIFLNCINAQEWGTEYVRNAGNFLQLTRLDAYVSHLQQRAIIPLFVSLL